MSKKKTKKIKENLPPLHDGLPKDAFAIVGDPHDPETWQLPHHSEHHVDWDNMPAAVAALSPGGYMGQRVHASEGEIIEAARHLANHYVRAGRSVPDTLAVLI